MGSGTFVTVFEWMVLDDVKCVRGRHCREVVVQILAGKLLARLSDGRFEPALIQKRRAAAEFGGLGLLNLQYYFQR